MEGNIALKEASLGHLMNVDCDLHRCYSVLRRAFVITCLL